MINATFINTPKPKRWGEIGNNLRHLAGVKRNGMYTCHIREADVKQFAMRDRKMRVNLKLPYGPTMCELDTVYGRWLTTKFARQVFGDDWNSHAFAIAPGDFWFKDGMLNFNGKLHPAGTSVILMLADFPMTSYGGSHGLISFSDEETGLYGLLIPLAYAVEEGKIFYGANVLDLILTMERGITQFRQNHMFPLVEEESA